MSHNEVESQLSAMFDGELPAAECELLSRRIERDEKLRARWASYALIGAAMRCEPVATARSGFARRVSAALQADGTPEGAPRARRLVWNSALAATLVMAVAGLAVTMLRDAALSGADARLAGAGGATLAAAGAVGAPTAALKVSRDSPSSYVTPVGNGGAATLLRTQLADYIVAHSAYSMPLLRRNVLSELVTSEDQAVLAPGEADSAGAAPGNAASGGDPIQPVSGSVR